jgi:hypothetical protein
MSFDKRTKPCCDSNCIVGNSLTQGNHPCFFCKGHMHAFCGKSCPGQEEGFGEKKICSDCFQKHMNPLSSAPTELVTIPCPQKPSLADTSNAASEQEPETTTETNIFIKDKLPTNFTRRDSKTIHFNMFLLKQIQMDGNFNTAFKTKGGKRTKGDYFDFVADTIIPQHFNPNDYEMNTGRNLLDKFRKFETLANKTGTEFHSTDSTGFDGESIDSDIELYLKMKAEDEDSTKKKTSENAKNRVIQTNIIGNQLPLVGVSNRSQVAAANKNDQNHNIQNADVTTNMTSVTTTTHRRPTPINNTPIKRKKNSPTPSSDIVSNRLMDSIQSSFGIEKESTSSREEVLSKTIQNMLDLNRLESRSESAKDQKNIDLTKLIIGEHLQSYYDTIQDEKDRERKRNKKSETSCAAKKRISFELSSDDSDSSNDEF